MRGFEQHRREPVQRHGMTSDYLEADMNDEGDLDEEGEEEAAQHTRRALSRGRLDDEEAEVIPGMLTVHARLKSGSS